METMKLLAYIFILLLLASSLYLLIQTMTLESKLKEANQEILALEEQAKALSTDKLNLQSQLAVANKKINDMALDLVAKNNEIDGLGSKLRATETAWNLTKTKLDETQQNLEQTKAEFQSIASEVKNLDQTLNESMAWFKANSKLPSQGNFGNVLTNIYFDGYLDSVEKACTNVGTAEKTLNLACVNYQMENALSITYKLDPNGGDRLFSIGEIISREGGDCEDISLFAKATINRVKENLAGQGYYIEAWKPASGLRYLVYGKETDERYWYKPDATGVKLGKLDSFYPYIVCFSQETNGHCIVALSTEKVDGVEDVSDISGALLFEPQNGEFLGSVGTYLATCRNKDTGCERWIRYVSFVITDSDLLQFKDGEWQSYEKYQKENKLLAATINESLIRLS